MRVDLTGKVAVVTGSWRGIGRGIAEGLVRAGARVWFHAPGEEGRPVAEAVGMPIVSADFTHTDGPRRLVEAVAAKETRVDVLVNNAAIERVMPVGAIDFGVYDACFAVNVRAAVELTQGLLPLLKVAGSDRGASVINVTSIHESVPYPHNAVYSMTKAALGMFTRVAAVELGPMGVRVNNLAPGAIETDINRRTIDQMGRENFATWIPAGRVGTVDEVVGPALFLASDAAAYVNGATLYADGAYRHNLVRYRAGK